jgi:cellulose synthase/poly-beta-1,6-N-acetylglucosamine synthase-like glycosyltransferase
VVDKENGGGKADAINAGINASRYPYFCVLDADAMLEEDALLRVAKPMLDDPDLVAATGGIVRIVNGSRVDHGRVLEVGLPKSWLATVQVVEYFRAFLVGRIGWSRMRSLLIISGAFGLFRRNLVETAGGFSTATVAEDLELVVRLHRHLRERGEEYRIAFIQDPVAWTEAPRTCARCAASGPAGREGWGRRFGFTAEWPETRATGPWGWWRSPTSSCSNSSVRWWSSSATPWWWRPRRSGRSRSPFSPRSSLLRCLSAFSSRCRPSP